MTFARFDQFEAYIEDALPEADRKALERQLAIDATLRAELDEYRQFRHSIESVALGQQLDRIHTQLDWQGELDNRPPVPRQPRLNRLRLALTGVSLVILLAGFGLYWSTLPAALTPAEKVYSSVYRPEPTSRGANDCGPELAPGIRFYRAGNYRQAVSQFDLLPASNPCVLYYRGITNLALNNTEIAISQLEQATAHPPTVHDLAFQKSQWYLALAHLKANQPGAARQYFRTIAKQLDNPFQSEARRALTELDHAH